MNSEMFSLAAVNVEKEVKLRMRHDEFLELLKRHGIKFSILKRVLQRDLILDFQDLRLLKSDRLFRIRLEDDLAKFTFKGKREIIQHSKRRVEIEDVVGSEKSIDALSRIGIYVSAPPSTLEELIDLLSKNGMNVVLEVVKERTPLLLKGFKSMVYLDNVKSLGEFIEIEGDDANSLVDFLGVSRAVVRKSYAEMIAGLSIHYL
ncbi:MAG TPA: CYTH domain-containing protein [Candidatus Korarchaeota archaeon]|nr:CYTH domain-containing protein [Candidatus Korarchaeota archaeon]